MDSAIKIALILTAMDRASSVITSAMNRSQQAINGMNRSVSNSFNNALDNAKKVAGAYAQIKVGQAGFNFLEGAVDAYAEQEKAAAGLKANMIGSNGLLDEAQWKKVKAITNDLGNELPGTTANMYEMFNALKEGGVQMTDILNGTGKATAYLAVVTHQSYTDAAKSSAILQNATGVLAKDMEAFYDDLSRSSGLGVKMNNLEAALTKSAAGAKLLGVQGLEASKSLSAIYGILDRTGIQGEVGGTAMGRIFSEISDPKKLAGMNAIAKQYGITMSFFDKQGKFGGMDSLVAQFDKLKNLNAIQLSSVLKPLTGGTGMEDNILKLLSQGGVSKIAAWNAEKAKAASLQMKLAEQLKTWDAQVEALQGTITNAKATIGGAIVSMLIKVIPKITEAVAKMQTFFEQHPNITKVAVAILAVASAGLILNGTLTFVTAICRRIRQCNYPFDKPLVFSCCGSRCGGGSNLQELG